MKDRDFLIWIHERLEHVHKENPRIDYMHKLRAIIRSYPSQEDTPNTIGGNSLEELKVKLAEDDINQYADWGT